ncbi:MAG TPA: pyridoxal phosphate-dependent aminotransferase [Candidatus Thermoplasmatota archaeon]|nr:pyridoxal phosphate-dependent aminotransferase [Candidatus Thermoplasmatota archaeon]
MDRLERFDLELWMRREAVRARLVIGGSGVPTRDVSPYVPVDLDAAWHEHPDHAAQRVCEGVAREYGLDPREVVTTLGASEGDFLVALALAGPGAHVVVEEPAYFSLRAPAAALRCRVTRVRRRPEDAFALSRDEVLASMRPDTRLVALARPNNPTGAVVPDADLVAIAERAERCDAFVLVDEVFADATSLGDRPARLLHDRIVSVNSVTKCLGFGPLKVGWCVASPEAGARIERAKGHVVPVNPHLGPRIAERVLSERRKLVAECRAAREVGVGLVRDFAEARGLGWSGAGHGTTCLVRLPGGAGDDVAFARRLLEAHGVLVAPGAFVEIPGWIRLGLVTPRDDLEAGLRALARATDEG